TIKHCYSGRISSSSVCNSAKPPEEYVTFKSSLDLELAESPNPSSKSRVIMPVTKSQDLSNTSQISSKNEVSSHSGKKHSSSISASRHSEAFYMEAKGMIIIALIIVILILCIQIFLETKSEAEWNL
ncbi:unnamed protein product, partial [Onchocerca flexuosa]|uniref:ZP domain-containing protein n=1 Tax=Onchocerca flexuosa TaxID=387005 RepID=A0A183HGF1_9BILA